MIFFLRQRCFAALIVESSFIFDTRFRSHPEVDTVTVDAVKLVDHPLIPMHESRANSSNMVEVQLGCVDPLGFIGRLVADSICSKSFFWAQLDGDIGELSLIVVAVTERGQSMVAVDVDEVQLSQLLDLGLAKIHFNHGVIFAVFTAAEIGWDWACLAIWIRPALGVFQAVDEVADIVSAAEIVEDGVESVHFDERWGSGVYVFLAVLWKGRV
jgi:hypothetical protein